MTFRDMSTNLVMYPRQKFCTTSRTFSPEELKEESKEYDALSQLEKQTRSAYLQHHNHLVTLHKDTRFADTVITYSD